MNTCLSCFNIFETSLSLIPGLPCPILQCEGKIIEVDENILPSIIQLNKKGYLTTSSCSGHSWGGSTMITFNPIVHPNSFSYLPTGFKSLTGDATRIVTIIPSDSELVRQRHIMKASIDLLEWSQSLPSAKHLHACFEITKDFQPAILNEMIQNNFQIRTEFDAGYENADLCYADSIIGRTYTSPNNADLLMWQIEKFANETGASVAMDIIDELY